MTASPERAMVAELARLTASLKRINDRLTKVEADFVKLAEDLKVVGRVVACLIEPVTPLVPERKLTLVGSKTKAKC